MVKTLPHFKGILFLIVFMIVGLYTSSYAQLSGTYQIPVDYSTLASAISDLNTQGVAPGSGGVVFAIAPGYTETAPSGGYLITATGTASDPITFQKDGLGTNPLFSAYAGGTGTPGSAAPDGVFKISGSDYITFNGIDITDPNVSNPSTMEFGFGFFKSSTSDGAQYNTVQNCTITLNRINNASGTSPMVEGSVGILVINSTYNAATTALTPVSAAGTNSYNKFYSNTIQNCNYCIVLSGYSASTPFTLGDTGNDIGGNSSGTGNTLRNFGGATSATNPAAGVRANNQWGINISYNNINNNNGSGVNHVTTLRGIYAQAGTSASATITHNTVTLSSGATTTQVSGIENAIGSTAASNTITIDYNTVSNCTYNTATSGSFYAIYNSSSAATVTMNNNIVNNNTLSGTGTFYGIAGSSPTNLSMNNNTVTNNGGTGTGSFYLLYPSSPTNCTIDGNSLSNNVRNVTSGTTDAVYMSSPTNITITNNTIDGNTFTGTASTGNSYGIYSYSSAVNETYKNNIFRNLTTTGAGTVAAIYQYSTSGTKIYKNNSIYNLSSTSTVYGIMLKAGATDTISSNTIYSLTNGSSTSGTLYGIYITSGTTNYILKNKIYDLSASVSTNPTIYGIYIAGGTTNNIYNNLVGKLTCPSANAAIPLVGIYLSSGTTNNLYYNTVYLNATSAGALFGSAALYASTTPTVLLRNNIFVNTSTPAGATGFTSAYRRSSTTLTSYGSASNNNCFYAGTPGANNLIFYDGTNSDQTLTSYQSRVSPRDANSFRENVNFTSTTGSDASFLHINTSLATQLESGGNTVTGITDDFDGDTRNVTTPDVGADEFSGIALDLTAPSISYTALGNTSSSSNRTLTTTISDASGVPTSGIGLPVLYWKKNTGTYSAVTGVSLGSNQYSFTFGSGATLNDSVFYYVVAQDNAGTPNVGSFPSAGAGTFTANPPAAGVPPTSPSKYYIIGSLSGTFNIPGSYATLTAAAADLNAREMTGPVNFILADGYSSASETFPIIFNANSGSGSSNVLTIKPATTATISGSYAGALLRFNGSAYTTLDGSNNGTSSRDLTISNTNTTGSGVLISSLGTGAGANHVTIKNCNINGGATAGGYGISIGGSTPGTPGDDNDNVTIQNNIITKCSNGVYAYASAAGVNDNLIISSNVIGSATDNIYYYGINVAYGSGGLITQNIVHYVVNTTTPVGINIGIGFINAEISRNKIHDITHTGTGGYGGWGLFVNTGNAASNMIIANNLIYGVIGDGYSSFNNSSPVGMYFDGSSGGFKIYYNSVYMSGNLTYSSAATKTTAILFNSSSLTGIDLQDNIFQNSMNNTGNASSKNYAIYSSAAASAFSNINYNDYYVSGAQGVLGYLAADISNISAWKTATGKDLNSISSDPQYLAVNDLRINSGSPVLSAGTPLSVTVDYTGSTRNVTTPTLGAYETAVNGGPTISYTLLQSTYVTENVPLTGVTITDADGIAGGGLAPRIYWKVGAGGTWLSAAASNGSSPYNFNIGTTGRSIGDVIYYYVIAQDALGNVTANPSDGLVATDVNTVTTPPTAPNSYVIIANPNYGNTGTGDSLYYYANSTTGGSGSPGQPSFYWRDTTGSTTLVQNSSLTSAGKLSGSLDDGVIAVPISTIFPSKYFRFYGVNYGATDSVFIGTNGYVTFGKTNPGSTITPVALPSSSSPKPGVFIFWKDMQFNQTLVPTNRVSYKTSGDTLVLTFDRWAVYTNSSANNYLTVQLIFVFADAPVQNGLLMIEYNYDQSGSDLITNIQTNNVTRCVGIQTGFTAVQYSLATSTGVTPNPNGPIFGSNVAVAFGPNNSILPLELTSFTSSVKERNVLLKWETKTEVQSSKFIVEKLSGSNWNTVGTVTASGNSSTPKLYSYSDNKLNTGKYSYRLKMVDNNGSYKYSSIIEAEIGTPTVYTLSQNYPNPFNPSTKIDYQIPAAAQVKIELYSITGERVAEMVNGEQPAGYYTLDVNSSMLHKNLASGVYIYRMIAVDKATGNNFVNVKKMIMLK